MTGPRFPRINDQSSSIQNLSNSTKSYPIDDKDARFDKMYSLLHPTSPAATAASPSLRATPNNIVTSSSYPTSPAATAAPLPSRATVTFLEPSSSQRAQPPVESTYLHTEQPLQPLPVSNEKVMLEVLSVKVNYDALNTRFNLLTSRFDEMDRQLKEASTSKEKALSEIDTLKAQLQGMGLELQKEKQKNQALSLEGRLLVAAQNGNLEVVTNLLELGADVNARQENGYSTLLLAVKSKNTQLVGFLMGKNADVYAVDAEQRTILDHLAADVQIGDDQGMLEFYLDKLPTLNLITHLTKTFNQCKKNESASNDIHKMLANKMLFVAVKQADLTLVRAAIKDYGADINAQDPHNNCQETALHKACYFGHADIAEFLLAEGARTDISSQANQTPIGVIDHDKEGTILSHFRYYHFLRLVLEGNPTAVGQYRIDHPELLLGELAHSKKKELVSAVLGLSSDSARVSIVNSLFNFTPGVNVAGLRRNLDLHSFGAVAKPLYLAIDANDEPVIKALIALGSGRMCRAEEHIPIAYARSISKPELADYLITRFVKERERNKQSVLMASGCSLFKSAAAEVACAATSTAAIETTSASAAAIAAQTADQLNQSDTASFRM